MNYCNVVRPGFLGGDMAVITIRSVIAAAGTLMRGFTSVRDVGGNIFSTQRRSTQGGFRTKGLTFRPSHRPDQATSTSEGYTAVPEENEELSDMGRNMLAMPPTVLKRARDFRGGAHRGLGTPGCGG